MGMSDLSTGVTRQVRTAITRLRDRGNLLGPLVIGAVALVLGVALIAWGATRGGDREAAQPVASPAPSERPVPSSERSPAPSAKKPESESERPVEPESASFAVATREFTSKAGDYRLRIPKAMKVHRSGGTSRFTAKDKSLVVTVGQAERGGRVRAQRHFLATLKKSYKHVRVLEKHSERVGGHRARTVYGRATNSGGTKLRFVTVMMHRKHRNFALTAYAAADSDPTVVVPRLNAIVNSFTIL